MNKISHLLIFIFIQVNLEAQILNKCSVDLNIGRFAKETGLFNADYYSNEITVINGFSIGYNSSAKWQYFLGLRKLNSTIDSGGGFTHEFSEKKGVEVRVGVKFSPKSQKKFFLSYGLEMFEELSNHKGFYSTDASPTYEVNHKKNYLGIAPSLAINIKLVNRIIVFADSRFRFGRVYLEQKESTHPGRELFRARDYWSNIYEPINSIGIKFKL